MRVLGVEKIAAAALASSIGFQDIPAGAVVAEVSVDTAPVRYQLNGSVPTATVGMRILQTADKPTSIRGNLGNARFILESGAPNMNITYWGS